MNDAPQQNASGITPGPKPLFHSRREIALIKDSCVKPGFGMLVLGTVLATCISDSLMTPNPLGPPSADLDVAMVKVLGNVAAAATTCTVSEKDAVKFRVGDNIGIANNDPDYEDLGAITAISAPVSGVVTITFTTAVTAADMTLAKYSAIFHVTKATTPFYSASCVLDKDLDTGTLNTDQPAPTSVVFGNAILYTVNMTGMTAQAITDLGARQHGVHTII